MSSTQMTGTLLRVATAGSVDDGKSTLIGRLLHDTKAILTDQLDAVRSASERRGGDLDLSLLTDGLRAEREQGITIDVAYRYFTTPRRAFILADTPGHVQYTRNTVTGASTADVAVVLVDARRGMTEQSRRHVTVAALLRVPAIVLAVNKVDLVGYDEAAFRGVADEFRDFASGLGFADVLAVPVSALRGDNVAEPSAQMPWYDGPTLLAHLESVQPAADDGAESFRLPVQWVARQAEREFRGYAGRVAGGVVRVGDPVVVLPSGVTSRVAAVETFDGPLAEARTGQSVVVRLDDEVDVGRGDVIAAIDEPPVATQDLDAAVCWLGASPLTAGGRFVLKHTTRTTRAIVRDVDGVLDVTTAQLAAGDRLALNDIGRITLRLADPIAADDYAHNRRTGAFLLIEESSGDTVGAGMIGPPQWGWTG